MARIVYISNGMASTVNSGLQMSHQLVKTGHEVSWLGDPDTCDRVKARGFEGQSLDFDTRFMDAVSNINRQYPQRQRNPQQWLRWWAARRNLRHQSLMDDELERKLKDLQPDLLLIDYEMHFAILATAKLGIPVMLPVVWFTVFRNSRLPLMHTDRWPPANGWGRLANRFRWWRCGVGRCLGQCWETWGPAVIRRGLRPVRLGTNHRSDLQAVANRQGYRLGRETSRWHWLKPHTYQNLPVLCYNLQEMDFPHQPHPNLHYVGPMVDRQRPDHLVDLESMQQWNHWLSQRATQSAVKPLVYCSLGTFWSADISLLSQIIDVFRNRPDWQLVIGLGGKTQPEAFAAVPTNVLILKYAPQLEVIANAQVAITHGGITSINECVSMGVPMLVFSTRHVDQDGCAARVQYHGLGMIADRRRSTTEQIAANLTELLTDFKFRANIGRMQDIMARYREERRAVRAVEEQLPQAARLLDPA